MIFLEIILLLLQVPMSDALLFHACRSVVAVGKGEIPCTTFNSPQNCMLHAWIMPYLSYLSYPSYNDLYTHDFIVVILGIATCTKLHGSRPLVKLE